MKLRDLLKALGNTAPLPDAVQEFEVAGIAHDSRQVVPGSLFVAVRGFNSDGHQFIPQAVKQGARAVVAEIANPAAVPDVPIILVPDTRKALATLAAVFYGYPSRQIKIVGITGTKGKTTTSYLVKSIIEAAGHVTGLIGTIDYRVGNKIYAAPNTTPESTDVQRLLREMADSGAEYCVMEVSSHALALGRTDECVFETAVFTNLQEDHLDFHKDRKSYFQAKLLLFTGLAPDKIAIINDDDDASREIAERTKAKISTFGLSGQSDIHPEKQIGYGIDGLSFSVQTPKGIIEVASPLVGKHNVYNILAAIGAASALGFDTESISHGIARMRAVPGRMEKVDEGQPFGVVVDYAHTEESLARLLEAVREVATGLVITVFGCGGDRDRTKRPKMGATALKGSDVVIVTSDNPRTEDPIRIIREIEAGMTSAGVRVAAIGSAGSDRSGKTPYLVNPDRRKAITAAISMAKAGDIVVLAGKGHEDYQIIGEKKIHFDDREVAREEIKKRQMAEVG